MYRTRYAALPLIPHFPSSSVWKLTKIRRKSPITETPLIEVTLNIQSLIPD